MVVTPAAAKITVRFKNSGTRVVLPSTDIYKSELDASPYITRSLAAGTSFGKAVFSPGVLTATKMLLE